MGRPRINQETLNKMCELRKQGLTYKEIMDSLGVSKWACVNYLKDVEVEASAIEAEWRKAEKEAAEFLQRMGFTDIHDLNAICPSPYWDVLARRDGQWWLIDVTVSPRKQIGGKVPFTVEGYMHAILYKNVNTGDWKLVRIIMEEVE